MERLQEIATRLREMYNFARGEEINVNVTVSQDEYYVDLGTFGESSMSVEVEDDYYALDAEEILDKYPIETYDFDSLANELEELASEAGESGTSVEAFIDRLERSGGVPLATALRESVATFTVNLSQFLSVGELPPQPLPWPGAMLPGIDYTAADFPRRYQPPPGFVWTSGGSDPKPFRDASYATAETAKEERQMVLDKFGRVKWIVNDGLDDYSEGLRWYVWHGQRDGLPEARGFGGSTPARALDADGFILQQPQIDSGYNDTNYNWSSATDAARAQQRLREIRETVPEKGAPVQTLGYDPLTVAVGAVLTSTTAELRLGDDITGSDYGRVLSVEPEGADYRITMNRNGVINVTNASADETWSVLPISDVDRDATPAAIEGGGSFNVTGVGYDPLTVEISDDEEEIYTVDLRLGDDIVGDDFGRVVSVESLADGTSRITMKRNGVININADYENIGWMVQPIVGVDRLSQPTALSLSQRAPGPRVVGLNYDPRTVPVKSGPGASLRIRVDDLRLGEDVIGLGKVVSVQIDPAMPGILSCQLIPGAQGGAEEVRDWSFLKTWNVLPLDLPGGRESVPSALALLQSGSEGITYDPLSVPLVPGSRMVKDVELRLGDDVLGGSFGRVVGVEGEQLVLDRDGRRTLINVTNEGSWETSVIDVPDRDAVPPAVQLGTPAPPVVEPVF
jgi:hypothetical protein